MIPAFLTLNAWEAAPKLLGWKLINQTSEGPVGGYIVEVEAYDMTDEASHSFRGVTARTAPMFEQAGTIYVYFTYGMHYCVNIVTGPINHGQAILIRAIEPTDGVDFMLKRRNTSNLINLTNGPAKLSKAMDITTKLTGAHIDESSLRLEKGIIPDNITSATRIGISKAKDIKWRFYITQNKYVSV